MVGSNYLATEATITVSLQLWCDYYNVHNFGFKY